jgi:hypothetical protein
MRTYSGRCHCGAVRFRFASDEITRGIRCNCSICARRGNVMSQHWQSLDELTGRDALALYQWGDHMVNFWFCRTCGIHPFAEITAEPGRYRINLGCIDEIDTLTLPIDLIDGKSF